jgi:hypothetical protein
LSNDLSWIYLLDSISELAEASLEPDEVSRLLELDAPDLLSLGVDGSDRLHCA